MKSELYEERLIGSLKVSAKHGVEYVNSVEILPNKHMGLLFEVVTQKYDPASRSSNLTIKLSLTKKSENQIKVFFVEEVALQPANWKTPNQSYIVDFTDKDLELWDSLDAGTYLIELTFNDGFKKPDEIKIYAYYLER